MRSSRSELSSRGPKPRLDEVQTIVAEEHVISDEESWHPEYAAISQLSCAGGHTFVNSRFRRQFPQVAARDAMCFEEQHSAILRSKVIGSGPNRSKNIAVEGLKYVELLSHKRCPLQDASVKGTVVHGIEERFIRRERDAVAPCPARRIDQSIARFGRTHRRWLVVHCRHNSGGVDGQVGYVAVKLAHLRVGEV
jgi:hypothetical protein